MFINKVDELPNIDRCLSPKRIINPYTKEVVYAPCRHCAACLNAKGSHWSYRVQLECKKHRYNLFVTLTYDNEHIPYYSLEPIQDENGEHLRYVSQFEIEKGCYDILDIPAFSADIRLNHDKYNRKYIIPTFNIKDVQGFFKRLRSKIAYLFKKNNIKDESQTLRYFLCSEYGGKTYRPHYHAILFFDSPTIMAHILQFLRESWTYGSLREPSLVHSNAPQYVAKYVAGNSRLPTFLQLKFTRPFHVQSKSPIIGYGEDDEKELLKNAFNGTYGHYQYDIATQSTVYVQPPRALEMRFFPKCRGYRSLSSVEKLRIYGYQREYPEREVKEHFDSAIDCYCARQCARFCKEFCVSTREYVRLLDNYYKNKDYYLLKQQLEYEKIYIENLHQPIHHLLGIDPTFYEQLPERYKDFIWSPTSWTCESFGIDLQTAEDMFYTADKLDPIKVELSKQKYSQFGINNRMKQYKYLQDANKTKIYNDTFNPDFIE